MIGEWQVSGVTLGEEAVHQTNKGKLSEANPDTVT